MNNKIYILSFIFATAVGFSSYAQDANNSLKDPVYNPNGSAYPPSSQLDSVPNEPDHTFGEDSSVYKLPATVPNKKVTVIYDKPGLQPEEPSNYDADNISTHNIAKTHEDTIAPVPAPSLPTTIEKP